MFFSRFPVLRFCPGPALALLFCAVPAAAARVDIVVDSLSPENAPLVAAVKRSAGAGQTALHELSALDVGDPIKKGRLLARLVKADLLVPIGDNAARFAARELPDTPAYFAGAAVLDGAYLAQPGVGGILAYAPDTVLKAAAAMGIKKVGLAYTPGYSAVADAIAARPHEGVALLKTRIASAAAVIPALRGLFAKADAVWVLGDPALVRGAGFEFLIEQSLARKVPVIAVTPWEVERGALFCVKTDNRKLAGPASSAIGRLLAANLKFREPRLETAEGGILLFNGALLREWGLVPPRGLPSETLK